MATYGHDETGAPLANQDFSKCTLGYEELSSAFPTHSVHVCVPLPHPHEQVRLLELDPVDSHDPNTAPALHGRLRVVHLREHKEYSALSYVWSQEDPGTSQRNNRLVIRCNGHQHEARIGPNCWAALWHLTKARGLTIWVDSICIDQMNSEEKAHQIPLMREIYESAHTTYFWLGEAATGTDEAMHYLATNALLVGSGTASDIIRGAFTLLLRYLTFQRYPHRSAVDNIFKRPWIKRIWTLQEAVLSHNSTIVCGERLIPWEDLICALHSIHFLRSETLILGFEDSYLSWLNLANLSRWFAHTSTMHPTRQTLLGQSTDRFNALDRKVYGQIRRLRWSFRVFWGLWCFIALCWLSLAMIPMFIGSREIWGPTLFAISLTALLIYAWLLNSSVVPTIREIGHSTKLYVKSHSIVQELRTRKATDPKDMYFGTLGILNDDSIATPDSILVLYKRLCMSLIRGTGSLDILLLANADTENRFPSWVVDWRAETPHIWDQSLHWRPTWDPDQAGIAQQDSVLMESGSWMRLRNFYTRSFSCGRFCESVMAGGEVIGGKLLQRYQGATPGLNLPWEFRSQGEHLCVHGLIVTEIISRFAPIPTRSSTIVSQSPLRVLPMSFERSNDTFEAAFLQSAAWKFTSLVYDALSDMPESERMKTVDRFNRLMDVLTGNTNSARLLWTWWRRLLISTANDQGTAWVENLLAEDKSLKDRLDAFMECLGTGGLNVVRCQRTELCTGGLGFAAAGIQEGDSVALVSGVSYPLVLRSCGQQHFKLIGPIFLPLVMNGELMGVVRPESMVEIILV